MELSNWTFLLAVIGLVGPGLIVVGRLWEKTTAAHVRLDKLEVSLQLSMDKLERTVRHTIETAWVKCPLANQHQEFKERKTP